jgi:uncharacterized protein (TIGR02284 family)
MNASQTVRTLNELITVSLDGESGFRACAEHVRDPMLQRHFVARAQMCARAAAELQVWVERLGTEPVRHGSRIGAVHRGWLGLRAALADDDDAAILAECERGEGHALGSYRDALDDPLPEAVRQVVLQQFLGVMENHEEIRRLHQQRGVPLVRRPTSGKVAPP